MSRSELEMRAILFAGAALLAAAGIVLARPAQTPGPPMRDFEAYYAAGRSSQAHVDPYSPGVWTIERTLPGVSSPTFELLPFVGPPATLPLWNVLARLPFGSANGVWRAVLVLSIAALAISTLQLSHVGLRLSSLAAVALFALGFGPLTSAFALGQVALPAFTCAVISLCVPVFGIGAWIQPNVALVLLSQAATRAGAYIFGAGVAIFASVCVMVAGGAGMLRYLSILRDHTRAERFSAIQVTPASIAYGLGLQPGAADTVAIVCAAGALLYCIVILRSASGSAARFCGLCAVLPFAIPFLHEHDLLLAFFPAVFLAARCPPRAWPLIAAGALLCATDWLGLAQRPDGAVQTVLLVGAAGTALFLLREDLHPRSLAVPAAVPALIALAAYAAHSHPAPIWPDAMSTVQMRPSAGAAADWHAEQAASGLFERSTTWAMMRAASLAGALLLACANLFVCAQEPRTQTRAAVPAQVPSAPG